MPERVTSGYGAAAVRALSRPRLASWTETLPSTPGQDLMAVGRQPDILSFALGMPSTELFPAETLGILAHKLMTDDAAVLQYGVPEQTLKSQIVDLMQSRGVDCSPADIFLTSGAQQAISLVLQAVAEPESAVLCDDHTYFGFLQAARPLQSRIITVPSDQCGMDVHAVEKALRNDDVRLIYVIPDGHNPLGVSLSVERRRALVGLAEEYGVPIVEDDAYGLLQYDSEFKPVCAYGKDCVFHVGSFSKTISPGLRVGWIVAPSGTTQVLSSIKAGADIDTGTFGQRLAAAYLSTVDFHDRIRQLRGHYRQRRDAMVAAIEDLLPRARWVRPSAGFFVWVELLDAIDTRELLRSSLANERIAFVPGSEFQPNPAGMEPCRTLRLSFSTRSSTEIREGIGRLARSLRRAASPSSSLAAAQSRHAETVRFPGPVLRHFAASVFMRDGVAESHAPQAADVLCTADEWGITSHGVARLRSYHEMLLQGRINPAPQIRIVRESPAVTVLDGDNGLGLVIGPEATRLVMERGRGTGAAWVAVNNSNHFGIAGYYAIQGLDRDLIGLVMTNTPALVSPLWGRGRMLGTNPIAAAFPTRSEPPVVIDMATSAISFGVVENALRNHSKLPENCFFAADGTPSINPEDLFAGGSLGPLGGQRETGGHKGFCLGSLVDLLCGVLPGAGWGPFVPPFPANLEEPARVVGKGVGHMFAALWTGAFCDAESFRDQMDDWVRTMRSTPAAEGAPAPLIPGDPERAAARENRLLGIPVSAFVAEDLDALGRELGLRL